MELDSEVERILHRSQAPERPPSSYGSMKSDEEGAGEEDITESHSPSMKPELHTYGTTGLQLIRSESPTISHYTEVTYQQSTRQHGAYLTDRLSGDPEEEEEEEEEEVMMDSPEPPPVPEDQSQTEQTEADDSQPGQLHPELDLPFIFRSIQTSLSALSDKGRILFKRALCDYHYRTFKFTDLLELDQLDLVDKMLEHFGKGESMKVTVSMLLIMEEEDLAKELRKTCQRALTQHDLKEGLQRRNKTLFEGVLRFGGHLSLKTVYTAPLMSTRGHGGVNPLQEIRTDPPSPSLVVTPESLIGGNNIFRLGSSGGRAVRTVLTTGLPGIGNSVAIQKFVMDWIKNQANQDIHYIFPLTFRELWTMRERHLKANKETSLAEMLEIYYSEARDMDLIQKTDCKVLITLDGLDVYQAPLDFQNTPVVSDVNASVHLDSVLVNLIRGSLLPDALIWITSRRGAAAQIPAELLHRVIEIQGFSDPQKDEYLIKRYHDDPVLAGQIVSHTKRSASLYILCHMPFFSWIMLTVLEDRFRKPNYGDFPPRLTSFYVHHLIIQFNRRLEKYHGADHTNQKWGEREKLLILNLGKLALRLLEKNRSVFHEDDVREHGLDLQEVVVFSGLCTELPMEASCDRRSFCFIHYSFLEFMAAFYTHLSFRLEGKNILEQALCMLLFKERLLSDVYRNAIDRALSAPPGHYDLYLRFLCGLAKKSNDELFKGLLYLHRTPDMRGMDEALRLLQKRRDHATPETRHNFSECLREFTKEDV